MTSPKRRVALAISLGALALGATACSDETVPDRDPAPATSQSEATDPAEATPDDTTESPSETTAPSPEGATAVPVYFVTDTPRGPRLVREFHSVADADPMQAATGLMLSGDTLDPDYRTLWPQMEMTVSATDGVLLVQIPDDSFTERPDGMSKRAANLALQQLVHTVQGVQQESVPVVIQRATGPARLFGVSIEGELTNADPIETMSLVNVTTPEQGAVLSGDTLEATGVASSFEATVPWEIRQGDEVVLDGFATAEGWLDKLYPWETSIDVSGLEPGTYTFVARTDDPSGGAEGAGPDEDTKDFVLE